MKPNRQTVSIEDRVKLLAERASGLREGQCFEHEDGVPGRVHLYTESSYDGTLMICVPVVRGRNLACDYCGPDGDMSGYDECPMCEPS